MVTSKLRNMHRTITRNSGKRVGADPWMASYTTAWQPGENSVIEQIANKYIDMDYEEAVVDNGVLFDMKSGKPPKIFGRNDSLKLALKSAYMPYKDSWTDYNKIVKIIRDGEDPEGDAFRYYLNLPRAGAAQWLYPGEVEAIMGEVNPKPKESITVGFDGSESDDHTVLFGCREDGDLFCIGAWAPRGDLHWRQEVTEAVDWTFAHFTVVRFYADPPYFRDELAHWAKDHGSPPIVPFETNQDGKMGAATGALRTAVRREVPEERVTIDPVPLRTAELFVANNEISASGMTLVQWHFTNAKTRKVKIRLEDQAEEAFVVRKDRAGSPLKIDSVPSAVLARRARDDAIREDEFAEQQYSSAAWQ